VTLAEALRAYLNLVAINVLLLLILMATPIPSLNLTHGQILWALARGTRPDRRLIDQVRYLRLLGYPSARRNSARAAETACATATSTSSSWAWEFGRQSEG
jgi:hypothetical protein